MLIKILFLLCCIKKTDISNMAYIHNFYRYVQHSDELYGSRVSKFEHSSIWFCLIMGIEATM